MIFNFIFSYHISYIREKILKRSGLSTFYEIYYACIEEVSLAILVCYKVYPIQKL